MSSSGTPKNASITSLTVPRRRAVRVVGAAALLTLTAASCAAPADSTMETWTSRPGGADAGSADAATHATEPEPVPEQLCVLTGPPTSTPGEALVAGDEFDGTTVDTSKWNLVTGKRGSSNVLNTMTPANASVRDGSLFVLTDRATDATAAYHSAFLDSLGRSARTYGRTEFRARFPYAAGVWFALWGRAWFTAFPEIDIEILNKGSVGHSQLYFVNHWAAEPIPADQRRSFKMLDDVDLSQWHTYSVLWKPGMLEWSIDGVPKLQSTGQGVPTLPIYWMINGYVGGWAQPPLPATKFPVTFEVDYMRVYRVDGLIADPVMQIANPATTYKKANVITVALANYDEACAHVEMYDGDKLFWTTSTAPYKFRLNRLSVGAHKLTFVATDGVRKTTTTADVQIQ